MTDEKRGRKLLWWNLNIEPDKEVDTGRWMMKTIGIWLGALVLVVVVIAVAMALF